MSKTTLTSLRKDNLDLLLFLRPKHGKSYIKKVVIREIEISTSEHGRSSEESDRKTEFMRFSFVYF